MGGALNPESNYQNSRSLPWNIKYLKALICLSIYDYIIDVSWPWVLQSVAMRWRHFINLLSQIQSAPPAATSTSITRAALLNSWGHCQYNATLPLKASASNKMISSGLSARLALLWSSLSHIQPGKALRSGMRCASTPQHTQGGHRSGSEGEIGYSLCPALCEQSW